MAQKKNLQNSKKSWWQKMLCQLWGVFFIVLPLFVYASLCGYNANDPSLNKVTTEGVEVHNFMGVFGAYAADAVLSTFGLALIIFLLVPLFWGYNLLRYQQFSEYKTRIFAWVVGVLCLACFLDLTCNPYLGGFNFPHNLTGSWSRILSRPLNNYINMVHIPYNTIIIIGIVLFVAILSFNFAAGITFRTWLRISKKIAAAFGFGGKLVLNGGKKIANIRNFSEFKELHPRYLQSKMQNNMASLGMRREPSFENNKISRGNELHVSTAMSSASAAVYQTETAKGSATADGLTIEIPQTAAAFETAPEPANKNSFSPTFAFIDDEETINKNKKKSIKPQGKTANSNSEVTQQTDLLSVSAKNENESQFLQPQKVLDDVKQAATQSKVKQDTYVLPSIDLLSRPKDTGAVFVDEKILKENALQLEQVLNDFGIRGKIVKVRPGPVVTLYELEPAPGIRTARIIGLSDDIARSMAVMSVRMAVVTGHNTIGIELPNAKRQTVWLRELLEDREFVENKNLLNVALGKDIGGQHVYADLSKMPHLLVAGTTGSGKSVGVNSMILSLLYRMTPEQCKFIMIDPKQLEFSMYNGIPHLLTPVITDPAKAVVGLKWAVQEMESRYRSMALLNVRNIAGYNKKVADMNKSGKEIKKTIQTGFDKETGLPIYEEQVLDTSPMPYIVIVVDEMADLMLVAGKEVEAAIQRLAQMARAAGIHLIMSTQRPSVDVITGTIKANFPSRISFHVTTKFDSTTILGEKGAEQLLGMGDMLYMPSGLRPIRVHGCFVADEEVERIVEFIKAQGEPKYVAEVTAGELNTKDSGPVFDKGEMGGGDAEEELYQQAVAIVRADKKASTSYVQRKLRIGYNRAANLVERMEQEGVVSKQDHVGRREVLGVD